jgi:FkbM family methyltransferase
VRPVLLKAKYAFHLLVAFVKPEVILDIGSMDGADSKRFARLVPGAQIVAFEANPYNYRSMCADAELSKASVRVEHRLVSDVAGETRFFVQRPLDDATGFNRGTSSTLARSLEDARADEVVVDAVRADDFLDNEYPSATNVAAWIDVEGFSYGVIGSMTRAAERIKVLHVEVETKEIWPGQRLESDVLALANELGFVMIARGPGDVQRDVILANQRWYEENQQSVQRILTVARLIGPTASRVVESRGWQRIFGGNSA